MALRAPAYPYPRPYHPSPPSPPSPSVLVVPEGTTSTASSVISSSSSSVISLVPLSSPSRPRLPKAPVFIRAPPAFVRLDDEVSDVSDPSTTPPAPSRPQDHRLYDFDDDFPSIAASDSTVSPTTTDIPRSRPSALALNFDLRRSLARRSSAASAPPRPAPAPPALSTPTSAPVTPVAPATPATSATPSTSATAPTPATPALAAQAPEIAGLEPLSLNGNKLHLLSEGPASSRRYDFSDDFASITGSEAPPSRPLPPDRPATPASPASPACEREPLIRCASEQGEYLPGHPRSSLASSIKNRISFVTREERGRLHFRGRGSRKGGIRPSVEDSILHDWQQASAAQRDEEDEDEEELRDDESDGGVSGHAGCASFLSRIFASKPTDESASKEPHRDPRLDLVDDSRLEDMQFVSILAYEEFMHSSPMRPSTTTKLLSRLRRN